MLDYNYRNRSSKSPDISYVPGNITVPPAKHNLLSTPLRPYPTVVIEIAHCNESWNRLILDSRKKAFSSKTSIQDVIGIKIFKKTYIMFWGRRARRGYGMCIKKITPKLDIKNPSCRVFNISANLIFWGCPQLPPLPSPNLSLRVEIFRKAIEYLF